MSVLLFMSFISMQALEFIGNINGIIVFSENGFGKLSPRIGFCSFLLSLIPTTAVKFCENSEAFPKASFAVAVIRNSLKSEYCIDQFPAASGMAEPRKRLPSP